ncbi:MAG: crosslink repair DNA glycosylase YcaQ family protein, partial [Kofleriaceae bacterium]
LARTLTAARIAAPGDRLAHLLMRAELDAVICSGARRGKHATYALVDDRCPATPPVDRDAALARLARRYVASHGPVLVADFAWWSGLTAADARRAFELAELATRVIEEQAYYLAAPAPAPRLRAPVVHLLPNFDEYLVAYKHRASVTDPGVPAAVGTPIALLSTPIVVLDGRVIGTWRRTITRTAVTVATTLAAPLDRAQRAALDVAVARYGRFLGLPAQLAPAKPRA